MNLEAQAFNKKTALTRQLRSLIVEYINWVSGDTLAGLADAIAALEDDLNHTDPLVLQPDGETFEIPPIPPQPCCPMGHDCSASTCDHRHLCREVAAHARH